MVINRVQYMYIWEIYNQHKRHFSRYIECNWNSNQDKHVTPIYLYWFLISTSTETYILLYVRILVAYTWHILNAFTITCRNIPLDVCNLPSIRVYHDSVYVTVFHVEQKRYPIFKDGLC